MRKVITLVARACKKTGLTDFRQWKHNLQTIKKLVWRCQRVKRSTSKKEEKIKEHEKLIQQTHNEYVKIVGSFLFRVKDIISQLQKSPDISVAVYLLEIERFICHADRQIDQIVRRVIKGEVIPHHEKVFSLFEEHTEWICKGKAGVPVELGVRVCVLEDQYGFLLHHRVMQKETDDKAAISIVTETKSRYPHFDSCSFDKGFHSPLNRDVLQRILSKVFLPKKGKLSNKDKELEHSEDFKKGRRKHSAVESAISALDNHGLDRCFDHGIWGFERYVAYAIVGRNLQILGNILQQNELVKLKLLKKSKKRV